MTRTPKLLTPASLMAPSPPRAVPSLPTAHVIFISYRTRSLRFPLRFFFCHLHQRVDLDISILLFRHVKPCNPFSLLSSLVIFVHLDTDLGPFEFRIVFILHRPIVQSGCPLSIDVDFSIPAENLEPRQASSRCSSPLDTQPPARVFFESPRRVHKRGHLPADRYKGPSPSGPLLLSDPFSLNSGVPTRPPAFI